MKLSIHYLHDLRNLGAGISAILTGDPHRRKHALYRLSMLLRGIDLSWVSAEDLGLDKTRFAEHGASGGPDLETVLDTLPIRPTDSVLDLGSGKAGAMITLARYPFQRVDGVEISAELCRISDRNLRRMGIRNSTVTCTDATSFKDLDRYTYIYIYNTFSKPVMEGVLDNIRQSLKRAPRHLRILYRRPSCDEVLIAAGLKKVAHFDRLDVPCAIYEAGPAF